MNVLSEKHGRDGIKWALEQWAANPITCTAIVGGQMNGYRTTHPQGSTYLRYTNDALHLDALITYEAERLGLTARGNNFARDHILVFWFVAPNDQMIRRTYDFMDARELLSKLLDLSDGDTDGAGRLLV